MPRMRSVLLAMLVGGMGAASCDRPQAETQTYFDRTIEPILRHSCSRQTTGCHVEDARGNAVGNLDTTSFEKLARRRDLLLTYGPYPYPALLQKVIEPQAVEVHGIDRPVSVRTDIRHAAGAGIDVGSDGFATLLRWLQNGATKTNVGTIHSTPVAAGGCRSTLPSGKTPDPGAGFALFQTPNNRVLISSVPRERSGQGSGMISTSRLLGQTMGAAVVALVFGALQARGVGAAAEVAVLCGAALTAVATVLSFARIKG